MKCSAVAPPVYFAFRKGEVLCRCTYYPLSLHWGKIQHSAVRLPTLFTLRAYMNCSRQWHNPRPSLHWWQMFSISQIAHLFSIDTDISHSQYRLRVNSLLLCCTTSSWRSWPGCCAMESTYTWRLRRRLGLAAWWTSSTSVSWDGVRLIFIFIFLVCKTPDTQGLKATSRCGLQINYFFRGFCHYSGWNRVTPFTVHTDVGLGIIPQKPGW